MTGIISFISPLQEGMKNNYDWEWLSQTVQKSGVQARGFQADKASSYDMLLIGILSGGVESQASALNLKKECRILLVVSPVHNALAASLEIAAYFRDRQFNVTVIDGNTKEIQEQLKDYQKMTDLNDRLKKITAGMIGKPSDWLIASHVCFPELNRRYGIRFKNLTIEELSKLLYEQKVELQDDQLIRKYGIQNPDELGTEEVRKAIRIYSALKKMISQYGLSALTLRCFDLLDEFRTTGCLALAMLNEEGITAGCEGDVPALITMVILQQLTGRPAFMANPVQIDKEGNSVKLVHCTVPFSLCSVNKLNTHFESGIGIGVQGSWKEKTVTVCKIGGKEMNQIFFSRGEIILGEWSDQHCRTQIQVKLKNPVGYFYEKSLSNHHVVIPGDWTDDLERLTNWYQLIKIG